MAYNPYKDIERVYNAKVAWNNATTDEERKRQNEIATAARKTLESYGYGDIANKVSASGADANAVKKILDEWGKKSDPVTGTYKSGIDNPAYNQSMATASNMNTKMFDTATSDHSKVNDKYYDIFDYANKDVTQTDEYKSAFANIVPAYNLKALQGRDNEVANGAASNGGNIDSFSAANAMRQQMAITAQGQQLAHQMGVDAYKSRVDNARAILSDLGVYNQGIYSTMDKAVSNEATMGQAYFDNEQTAKNNETARLSEQAAVTGYVPNEWTIKGDDVYKTFLNTDGSFKSEYNNTDIQALINQAKASGDNETAQKLAVVRARKILGDYGSFSKYANEGDVAFMKRQRTADYDLNNKQIESAERIANGELEGSKYAVDAQERMNFPNNVDAGGTGDVVDVVWMEPIDKEKLKEHNVDEFGEAALKGLIGLANKMNSAALTEEEIIEYLVNNSKTNRTNKDQLIKVLSYLGLGSNLLDNVENANADQNNDGWQAGVKYK